MPVILKATPVGASNANSYLTVFDAQVYFDGRLPLAGWNNATNDDKAMLLVMATRTLDAFARPFKWLVPPDGRIPAYYRVRRQWTGAPTTSTQRLAWPRTGMYNGLGVAIASNVIPQELKDATSELAGQLGEADRILDNEVAAQGITSIRAGSVALTFKNMVEAKVLPDAVWDLMPPSWFTDELIIPAWPAQFDVVS